MPKVRSPNRDKAFEIYKEHNGDIPLVSIAEQLGETDGTVRGWKSKDKWDSKLNGTFQTKNNKNTERSKQKESKTKKSSSSISTKKNNVPIMDTKQNLKTNLNSETKNRGAPKGNKNAVGNKGGKGAVEGNKYALTTGEYETILFDDVFDEKELKVFNCELDIRIELENELKLLTIRESRILRRIKRLEDDKQLVVSSVSVLQEDDNQKTMTVTKSKNDEILKQEDALTRVQSAKARVIEKLHKIDVDVERLDIERKRLKIYKNKQLGIIDLDECLADDLDDDDAE